MNSSVDLIEVEDLCKRLEEARPEIPCRLGVMVGDQPIAMCLEAATLLRSQAAENARLREALERIAQQKLAHNLWMRDEDHEIICDAQGRGLTIRGCAAQALKGEA